jgi:inner membrane transporter RhtA
LVAERGRGFAVGLILLATFSVQFGAGFAVTLFDRVGPAGAVLLRLTMAAAVLLALWRPKLRGLTREQLRLVGAFGVTLGLMNWTFYESLDRIPLGAAVTLEFIGPLGVAVAGSRRPLDVLWVLLAGAGVVLLAGGGGGDLDPVGVALALLAGVCWASYILLSARTGRALAGGTGLALAMAPAALIPLPAAIVQGGTELLVPELLAAGAVIALASSVIPYSLELEALRTLPPSVFGVLMSLEPGVATFAGFLVLGQELGARDLLAIGMVVVASIGATVAGRRAAA